MKLHYHNHGFEYEQFENKCLLDWMAEETDPEKWGFILDVYWTSSAAAPRPARSSSSATAST